MKRQDEAPLGCAPILIALVVGAITLWLVYLIGTSDLPEWLKFWLLK